jgi:hypothetical protein
MALRVRGVLEGAVLAGPRKVKTARIAENERRAIFSVESGKVLALDISVADEKVTQRDLQCQANLLEKKVRGGKESD